MYINNIDDLALWILNNHEDFREWFPEEAQKLKEEINSNELMLTNFYQSLPDLISYHISEAESKVIDFERIEYFERLLDIVKGTINKSLANEYLEQKRVELIPKLNQYKEHIQKKLQTLPPQQPEAGKPNEVKKELYNHIFKGNAFEVWESMFDSFQIKENSRTDVKFIFEEMKKDGLIHNTVNQKSFLDWILEKHDIVIEKTSNYSKTKERISIYRNAKQLYKSQGMPRT
ncbi:MAG: hypothetical protein IT246_09165 [Bacteroidia bacterium]|nr:hypothetical protein [Bacteroidia bacterium]HRO09827.1 hypothetical protein [Saprospiraceae bacterium]HRP43074.1 hypothetical protein [Saprospiraceae bacterium]